MLVAEIATELNIKLHFLPPYSPNLNPIERLWKVMNEKVRNNRFFKDNFEQLKTAFSSLLGLKKFLKNSSHLKNFWYSNLGFFFF